MPASITLTVSHLPTSTSFFLSALQPLGYVFRAREANTIGFGPQSSSSTPADFWITQEIPGVPAGAAHVAFPATNPAAVQSFFHAALKAGGKIHGEPAVRDSSGYYSAAIIDFDGNSIEAVYRPTFSDDKENDVKTQVSSKSSAVKSKAPSTVATSSVSRAAPSEVRSTASIPKLAAASQVSSSASLTRRNSGDLLDSITSLAKQVVNTARGNAPDPAATQTMNSGTSDAIVGTLLGVAAGAALHYVFSNRNNDSSSNDRRPSLSGRSATAPDAPSQYYQQPYYRAIEAAPSDHSYAQRAITMQDNDYASTVKAGSTHSRSRRNSGSAIATPFGIAGSAVSRQSGPMLIEPRRSSPPSAYMTPTAITSAESSASKAQSTRRSSSSNRSHSSRHSDKSERTVIRVTESVSTIKRTASYPTPPSSDRGSKASTMKPASKASKASTREPEAYALPPSDCGSKASTTRPASKASKVSRASTREPEAYALPPSDCGSKASTIKPASKASKVSKASTREPEAYALPPSDCGSKASTVKPASKASKASTREPEAYPLPPSRASTWTGSFQDARSQVSKSGGKSSSGRSNLTKSVVSKIQDMARLDVSSKEVRPEDSVSQISSRA